MEGQINFDTGVFGYVPAGTTEIAYIGFEMSNEQEAIKTITAVKKEKKIVLEDATIEAYKPSGEPDLTTAQDLVLTKGFERMVQVAKRNKEWATKNMTVPFDLKRSELTFRKLIARILSAANMLAVHGRRGPANFVVLGPEYFKMLFFDDKTYLPDRMHKIETSMAGLQFYISDIGGTVIVGREVKDNEPGIYLQLDEQRQEDFVLKNGELSEINIRYSVTEVGDFMPYISFDIVD